MIEILAQITAPKPKAFTAGLVMQDGVVVETAPIIAYMKRGQWSRDRVRDYCRKKGWDIRVVYEVKRRRDG